MSCKNKIDQTWPDDSHRGNLSRIIDMAIIIILLISIIGFSIIAYYTF